MLLVFSRSFIFFVDYLCGHSYYLYKSSRNVIYPTTHFPSKVWARWPGVSFYTRNKSSPRRSFSATQFAFLCFFLVISYLKWSPSIVLFSVLKTRWLWCVLRRRKKVCWVSFIRAWVIVLFLLTLMLINQQYGISRNKKKILIDLYEAMEKQKMVKFVN